MAGVLCQSVKWGWDQQPDFQRYNTQDSLPIRCLNMDLGAAAPGTPMDPPWSVAVAPRTPSATFLDHSFPWCFIQLKTPKLFKVKCSGWRKLPQCSWSKNKCFHRCRPRLLCQHNKNNMERSRTLWIFPCQLCYLYHWEEISKPEYPEVGEAFLDEAAPHTGKICTTHPSQTSSQHSWLTRNKFKHGRWWAHNKCPHLCYLPKKQGIKWK